MNTDEDIIELAKRYRNEIENSEASGMAQFGVDDVYRLVTNLLAVYAEVQRLRERIPIERAQHRSFIESMTNVGVEAYHTREALRSRLRRACDLLRNMAVTASDVLRERDYRERTAMHDIATQHAKSRLDEWKAMERLISIAKDGDTFLREVEA